MGGALDGLVALDLATYVAAPFCCTLLGELGADVIKVEQPGLGDDLRRLGHQPSDGVSYMWLVEGRNKKSVTCNLREPEGQALIARLAARADILAENFRPGTMEKWNLGYDALSAVNPRLVMVRISAFGQTGPSRGRPGFGRIAGAVSGVSYISGYPDRPPVSPGTPTIPDYLAGVMGAFGALAAIESRHGTGLGQVVDVALYEAVFNMMEGALPEYDLFEEVRERTGSNLTGIVPSNTYLTRDAQHVVIGANADSIFKRLMKVIGREDLADDPSLADNAGRAKRGEELDAVIGKWTAKYDADDVVKMLNEAQVPSGKIYSIADIARDVQYLARDMIRQVRLKDGTALKVPGIVPKLSATPGDIESIGPELGEHTAAVLAAHGYSKTEIAGLRECKAI